MNKTQLLLLFFLISQVITSCEVDPPITVKNEPITNTTYKTKNVIIVVIDGPRYSETWGHSNHQYIPRLSNELAEKGVVYTQFYNNGPTYTNAGHTAITTGNYQEIDNGGMELPENPSIFQHWLKTSHSDSTSAWVITSKGKLEVLANCNQPNWNGNYTPSTNCGIGGLGATSGYRNDSLTYKQINDILSTHHPQLVLINFREPDYSGHANNWNDYIQGIYDTDEYVYKLWNYIESDSIYAGSTTLFVTNDHGRHLDSVSDGFVSHGDNCEGCRHINLFACGPDFKQNQVTQIVREQIDIPATIAELMNFEFPNGKGEVMSELFE